MKKVVYTQFLDVYFNLVNISIMAGAGFSALLERYVRGVFLLMYTKITIFTLPHLILSFRWPHDKKRRKLSQAKA